MEGDMDYEFTRAGLEELLPRLTDGLLYGGVIPYILIACDRLFIDNGSTGDTFKNTEVGCSEWLRNSTLPYPPDVTDVVVLDLCSNPRHTLAKVSQQLHRDPSLFARPNFVVVLLPSNASISSDLKELSSLLTVVMVTELRRNDTGTFVGRDVIKNGHVTSMPIHIEAGHQQKPLVSPPFNGFWFQDVRVVTRHQTPFVSVTVLPNSSLLLDGIAITVLSILADQLHFRPRFELNDNYGPDLQGSKGGGMVEQLFKQEVDLIAGALEITPIRQHYVSFTHPFWYDYAAVAVKKRPSKLFYILRPFSKVVWLTLAACFILTAAVFLWITKLSYGMQSLQLQPLSTCQVLFYHVCLWMQQTAQPWTPRSLAPRVVSSFILLALVTLAANYSGRLVSSLVIKPSNMPLTTLQELADSVTYTPLLQEGSVYQNLFQNSSSQLYRKLYEKVLHDKLALCQADCLSTFVRQPHLAAIGILTILERDYIPAVDCQAAILSERVFHTELAMALPLSTPYKPAFDRVILRLRASGIFEKIWRKYVGYTKCSRISHVSSKHILSLGDTYSWFVTLATGVATATLVFMFELALSKCRRHMPRYKTD